MKLTQIAATLLAMGWGTHIDIRPAIASHTAQAMQEQAQLRKKQKQFKKSHGKATQSGDL
jgi:hypothetical protein